jgi:hypothetical protein
MTGLFYRSIKPFPAFAVVFLRYFTETHGRFQINWQVIKDLLNVMLADRKLLMCRTIRSAKPVISRIVAKEYLAI